MTVSLALMATAFAQSSTVNGALTLPHSWGIVALIAANVFAFGFGASWAPVVWVLLGEMFPNRIRALAVGLAGAAQWIANFVVSTTFPTLATSGLQYAYGFYGACALLAFIFVWKAVPETNGKQLESMDELADETSLPTHPHTDHASSVSPREHLASEAGRGRDTAIAGRRRLLTNPSRAGVAVRTSPVGLRREG